MGDKYKYKKSKGNAGLEGVQFQLDLLITSLLNAFHSYKDWKISSENQDAGKYDDLVVELPDKNILLQAKFKQTKTISRDQLFSCNSKNVDFSLPKYFLSYLEIKPKFKKKTVIICTNTGIDEKGLDNALICHCVDSDSTLHCEGTACTFFTFNVNITPELKASAEYYLDKNLQGKGIDKAEITEDNIAEFLENLQIFTKYPSGEKLHKIIDRLLSRLNVSSLWCDTTYHEIYRKIEDWFQQPKGEYLTEARAKAMLCEIKSDKYCELLKNYNVCFRHNDFNVTDSKVFHVKTHGCGLLQMLKIFRSLEGDKSRKLYVSPDESTKVQEQMIGAFELSRYTYLVMIWNGIKNEVIGKGMCQKLKEILTKNAYKKVILVVKNSKVLHPMELTDVCQVDGSETMEDISQISCERLLKKRNVVFQGKTISLKELLRPQTSDECSTSFDCVMLEDLIKAEHIKVGECLPDLDDTAWYYINRKFERYIDKTEEQNEVFTEESIFDEPEKVVVISDSAGMGKSTVLTDMAARIKEKYANFWVIRANLNDYTRILRDSVRKNRQSISLTELLNSRDTTKLSNNFERFVFSMKDKVVLMLDGVDEISPDYTRLILRLLTQCREACNVKKIFVTTRPHMARELKTVLKVDVFKLLPFTRSNQIDFLTRYWSYNLQLDSTKDRVEWYAEDLIDELSLWVQLYRYKKRPLENPFAEIPLQLRMLAEIFQEKCKEYLNSDGIRSKLLGDTNIVRLYEMFIQKKRDVYLDKANPSGNTAAKQALVSQFEVCLAWHRSLAAKIIMSNSDVDSSTSVKNKDMENLILKIGIVQRFGDGFQFVHKTFAEYFLAEYIVKQLQLRRLRIEFQKFLIDVVLQDIKYGIVCDFLDNLLQKVVHSLPPSIFEGYHASTCESFHRGHFIFELSKGGWVAILRLILKCINFKIVTCKKISIKHLKRKKEINTLNDLQFLVRKAGINVTNESGDTPLHNATDNAHLSMTRFLIEQGADVNIKNLQGDTALHTATVFCFTDIVQCLVEYKSANVDRFVDLDITNNKGETALYIAAESDFLNIVKYLVVQGANVTISDNTGRAPLHVAAHEGNSDTVLYLAAHGVGLNVRDNKGRTPLHVAVNKCGLDAVKSLVGHGADVNVRDNRRRTPLHVAADRGKMDIVEYLVQHGADCNIRNKHGHTALHLAALAGGSKIVRSPAAFDDVADSDNI